MLNRADFTIGAILNQVLLVWSDQYTILGDVKLDFTDGQLIGKS